MSGLLAEAKNMARHALVAMRFDTAQRGALIARIEARDEGIVSYALTHIGLAQKTIVEFYQDRVGIANASWAGYMSKVIPYAQIASVRIGFLKPISNLFFGGLLLGTFCLVQVDLCLDIVMCMVGLYFVIDYFFSKTIAFELCCTSGEVVMVAAKRSLFEWCGIDERKALELGERINDLIVGANS